MVPSNHLSDRQKSVNACYTALARAAQVLSSSWNGWPFGNNRYGPKRGGALCPFWGRQLRPHLTQCSFGWRLRLYQAASWSIQPFGHNRHGLKIGGVPLWGGAGYPSNSVTWAEVCLPTKWHLNPSSYLATTDMGQKLGEAAVPLFLGEGAVSMTILQRCLSEKTRMAALPESEKKVWQYVNDKHDQNDTWMALSPQIR